MTSMENTISIKLPVSDIPAQALMKLKKMTGLAIEDIKSRALSDDPLLVCEYSDLTGLRLMNRIRREMNLLGIEVRQFEDGEEKPSALFDSLEKTHIEISLESGLLEEDL